MFDAGVKLIRWGIETGHPRILKLMNKGTRLSDTVRVLRDASDAGIWNHATIILGFPTETREEADATVNFLKVHQEIIHSSILYQFVLLDHSYIFNHPRQYGISDIESHGNVFSNVLHYRTESGMTRRSFGEFYEWARKHMREEVYDNPFWYYLRVREYLFLFVKKFGKDRVEGWKMDPRTLMLNAE